MTDAIPQADGAGPATEEMSYREEMRYREVLGVLYDRLLVQRIEPVKFTEGGLEIPDQAIEPLNQGIVIRVGHGRLMRDGSLVPLIIRAGDRVLFGQFSGAAKDVETPGGPLKVLREDEVLAYWRTEAISD